MFKLDALMINLIQLSLSIDNGSTYFTILLVNISIEVAVIFNILLTPLDDLTLVLNLVHIVLFQGLNILFQTSFALSKFGQSSL